MTPAERRMITELFDRIDQLGGQQKDSEADQLIREAVRANPDAAYLLVQSTLVQEEALRQANQKIEELESRGAEGSGSFLGRFGLGGGSVPSVGAPAPEQSQQRNAFSEAPRGSFLGSALSTAASVAGGMLLADGIRGLFGGNAATLLGEAHRDNQAELDRAQDQAQDARDDAEQAREDLAADDAALDEAQDASDDRGGWDDGSMDI